jgi:hypothetical protein
VSASKSIDRGVLEKKRDFIFRMKMGENERFETWSGLPEK